MKFKKSVIVLGIFMGCAGVFGGMVMKNHSTEAAVAVWDEKNIAEAIKTVLNTTNILTEEQKQVALELLNMKSLDIGRLQSILNGQMNRQDEIWNEHGAYSGVLAAKKSVSAEWDDAFGKIDLILDGNVTPQDIGQLTASGIRLIDRTNKDAANAAKNQQRRAEEDAKEVQQLLQDSQNAEGEMQVQQAGNALLAKNANAINDSNELIGQQLTIMTTEAQYRNAQRAKSESEAATSIAGMNSFTSSIGF